MKDPTAILIRLEERLPLYEAFRVSAETAIRELLRLNGINIHSVTSRTKSSKSLSEKLRRTGKDDYACLEDVTDIVGIRVITHIEDEVDVAGQLIRREFVVDSENSIDKREALDPDRFGYLSLHFVCNYGEARTTVAENKRFSGLTFEIQIRSILQHAWAEIEHDLGYKAGSTIPKKIRRRFSRLAGLLEIADDEFRRLRDELNEYVKELPAKIKESPENVALDDSSLGSYINSSPELAAVDSRLVAHAGSFSTDAAWPDMAGNLTSVGISSIEALTTALKKYEEVIVAQWKDRVDQDKYAGDKQGLRRGLSLFHLWQVMSVARGGENELVRQFGASDTTDLEEIHKIAGIIAGRLGLAA